MAHSGPAFQNSKWDPLILDRLQKLGPTYSQKLHDATFQSTFGKHDVRTALEIIVNATVNQSTVEVELGRMERKKRMLEEVLKLPAHTPDRAMKVSKSDGNASKAGGQSVDSLRIFKDNNLNKRVQALVQKGKLTLEDFTEELKTILIQLDDTEAIEHVLKKIGECRFENLNYRQAYLWNEFNSIAKKQNLKTRKKPFPDDTLKKQPKAVERHLWYSKVLDELHVLRKTRLWEDKGMDELELKEYIGDLPYKMAMDVLIILQQKSFWSQMSFQDKIDTCILPQLRMWLDIEDPTHLKSTAHAAGGASAGAAKQHSTANPNTKPIQHNAQTTLNAILRTDTSKIKTTQSGTQEHTAAYESGEWASQVQEKLEKLHLGEIMHDHEMQTTLGAASVETAMNVLKGLRATTSKQGILKKLALQKTAYHANEWAPEVKEKLEELHLGEIMRKHEMQTTLGAASVKTVLRVLKKCSAQSTNKDILQRLALKQPAYHNNTWAPEVKTELEALGAKEMMNSTLIQANLGTVSSKKAMKILQNVGKRPTDLDILTAVTQSTSE